MFKIGVLILSLLSSFALATVVPISPFKMGNNSPSFDYEYSGALVDSKIYIFGGVFNVKVEPYVVDPDAYYRPIYAPRRENNTDLSFVYDAFNDRWEFETKTPIPWNIAKRIVVGTSIYFYDIQQQRGTSSRSSMYKYDTLTKEWSRKSDIPFLWVSELISCYNNAQGKIYFTNRAGFQPRGRTIIHSYDVNKDQWDEETIFTKEIIAIHTLMCAPNSFKVIAKQLEKDAITGELVVDDKFFMLRPDADLFTISIDGSKVVAHNVSVFNLNDKRFFDEYQISVFNEYFYKYSHDGNGKASLTQFNTITLEEEIIEADLPYNFTSPLLLPINQNEIFLLGGRDYGRHRSAPPGSKNNDVKDKVNTWNHKIIKV